MTNERPRKNVPLSLRLSVTDMEIIDRAASIVGQTRVEFARYNLVRVAVGIIVENQPIRMSANGFSHFLQAISRPVEGPTEMVRFMSQ